MMEEKGVAVGDDGVEVESMVESDSSFEGEEKEKDKGGGGWFPRPVRLFKRLF